MADDAPAGGVGEVAVGPAQQRPDPAHQLAQRERLGDVVVRAELEAHHLVELVATGREEQDGRLRAAGAAGGGAPRSRRCRAAARRARSGRAPGWWRTRAPPRRSGRPSPRTPPAGGRTGCLARRRTRLRRSGWWRPRPAIATPGARTRGDARAAVWTTVLRLAGDGDPTTRSRLPPPRPAATAGPPITMEDTTCPIDPDLQRRRRTVTGKAVARLRHEGRLPAVVFGHGDRRASRSRSTRTRSTSSVAMSARPPWSTCRWTARRPGP